MNRGQADYEFIGTLAVALYTYGIQIRISTLQKIVNDKGAHYGGGIGVRSVVTAARTYWATHDPTVYHAITYAFTDRNDESLFK
jgi:hypothetical protein